MRGREKRWEKGMRNKLKGNKHRRQKVKEGEGPGKGVNGKNIWVAEEDVKTCLETCDDVERGVGGRKTGELGRK